MASHRTLVLALLTWIALLAGCVYRPDIQQGNILSAEDVRQVTVGMTRSQVRFLLGTPMVSDPFAPQRWDYVYRMQRGRDPHVDSAHFVVYFDGDKVVRVEMPDAPETTRRPSSGGPDRAQPAAEGTAPAGPNPPSATPVEPPKATSPPGTR